MEYCSVRNVQICEVKKMSLKKILDIPILIQPGALHETIHLYPGCSKY